MAHLDPDALVRHLDTLHRAAWALCGSREDAEDLVQDLCARVLAKPRRLHGDDEISYLVRALRNTFLTTRRAASRRPRADVDLGLVAAADRRAGPPPEQAAETARCSPRSRRCRRSSGWRSWPSTSPVSPT